MKKTRTRWLALLLVWVLLISSLPTAAMAVSAEAAGGTPDVSAVFSDVASGDWYYDAVQFVYENGLMNGTGKTTFAPRQTTSRGMIVTILHRMEGEPSAAAAVFSDVAESSYCGTAVAWAAQNGIVTGYDDGTFRSDAPITRQQLAAILYRYAVWKGRAEGAESADLAQFGDADTVSAYAREAFSWAVGTGIILGTGANTLSPSGNATRAQAAVILMRFSGWLEDEAEPDKPSGSHTGSSDSSSDDSGSDHDSSGSSGGSSGDSSGSSGSDPGGDTASGGEDPENYSIIDVTVEDGAAALNVYTKDACTLSVRILSDDGKTELHTASAQADAGLTGGTVRVPLAGTDLPKYYRVEAVLTDSSGAALSNAFSSRKYTEAQEKFDALTIHDFPEAQVIDFIAGDNPNENFGVLQETVKTLNNIQAVETGDGAYVLPGLTDEQRASLAPGDVLYLPGTGGEPVLVKVGSVTTSGGDIVIVPDENVYLADFYQVFKLDMEIPVGDEAAEPQELQAQLIRYDAGEGEAGHVKDTPDDDEKAITIRVEADLGTDTVHASAQAEGTCTLRVRSEYDPELFGEDYFLFETTITTEVTIGVGTKGALGVKKDIELFGGSVDIPNLPGASIYVKLLAPVKLQATAQVDYSLKVRSVQGVRYTTDDGKPQPIKENSGDGGTFTPKGALEMEAGIAVEVGIGILKNCVTLGLSAGLGAEAELTRNQEAGQEKAPGYHACALCLDGEKNLFAEVKMTGKYHITSFLEGDIVELTLVKFTWDKKEFYCSVINEPNSIHAGIPTTGDGKCPNWKYHLTVVTRNSAGETVTGIPVTVRYLYEANQGASPFTGNSPYSVYLYNNHTATASATIEDYEVTSGQFAVKNSALTVTLQVPKATVAGVITDEDSREVLSGVSVKAVDQDGVTAASTASNASGGYTLKLPVGTFTITAEKSGYQKYTLDSITVQAKEELTRNITMKVTGGAVTGTVKDKKTGEPVSGANIALSGAGRTAACITGADGTYESEALPAGDYTVTVTAQGYSKYTGTVTVTAQGATHDVRLDNSPATLKGSVVTLDTGNQEQAVSGAVVTLYDPEDTETPSVSVTSGADGAFTVEVPAGTYTLKVTAEGYVDHAATLTLTANTETERKITLYPGGSNWRLEGDTLYVWGNGPMPDYGTSSSTVPWKCVSGIDYRQIRSVVIDSSLTSIGNNAFSGFSNLTSVSMPDSITRIGDNAFYQCSSLPGITIPGNVETIGAQAFYQCSQLGSIVLPDSVTSIGDHVFQHCSKLQSVRFSSNIKSIPLYAFADTGLTSLTLPDNLNYIQNNAFDSCASLEYVRIPGSVVFIGKSAFVTCKGLKEVLIEEGVQRIENGVFVNCWALTTIYIPKSATIIRSNVLYRCYDLTTIYYGGTEEEWAVRAPYIGAPETATVYYNCVYS